MLKITTALVYRKSIRAKPENEDSRLPDANIHIKQPFYPFNQTDFKVFGWNAKNPAINPPDLTNYTNLALVYFIAR